MINIDKVAPKEKMIPFVGKVKTKLDKRIDHVQAGLKADTLYILIILFTLHHFKFN